MRTLMNVTKILDNDGILQKLEAEKPTMREPIWESILVGILAGLLSFAVILFIICCLTRGIKWFVLWIIDGFKSEENMND